MQELTGDGDLKFRRVVGAGYWLSVIIRRRGNRCDHPERVCGNKKRQPQNTSLAVSRWAGEEEPVRATRKDRPQRQKEPEESRARGRLEFSESEKSSTT